MTNGVTVLTYAVRFRVIGHYLGQLAAMLALLTLVPGVVAAVHGEQAMAWRYAVVVALLLGAFAIRPRAEPEQIQSNEAVVIVVLAFVVTPLLATVPLMGSGLEFVDALFEAVSAITTTGLSTVGAPEDASPGFLFARAWMQWYGGLGIAVLSVALLMGHHAAARRLVQATETENIATTARTQARQVLAVYAALTAGGTLLLWVTTGDGFAALLHMLATVSTGGFAPHSASLAALPAGAGWIVTAFSILGAVPLLLFFYAARGRVRELVNDPEVRALGVAIVAVVGLLTLSLRGFSGLGWDDAMRHGAWLGVAAQTTTGFSSLDPAGLDPVSQILLLASMAIGGGSGSTAGGIKLLRLLVLLRLLQFVVRRSAMPPHAAAGPRLADRPLESAEVERAALILFLFVAVAGLSWLVFVAYGYAPVAALFEVTSALGTVGLSSGIVSATLEWPLKLLLCADMLLGRLELLAVLVLLYPRTWMGRRS